MSARVSNEFLESLKMPRPPCPVCEWPLWLWQIEIDRSGASERQMFMCARCEHEEVRVVARGTCPSAAA